MDKIVAALLSLGLIGSMISLIAICVPILLSGQGSLIDSVNLVILLISTIASAASLVVAMYKVVLPNY